MIYRLIYLNGSLQGQRITVSREPMTIGSAPECSVVINDADVAQQHAVLEHQASSLVIRDLGAMGRILVNGHETHAARLKHGDEIEIGRIRLLVQAVVQAEVEHGRPRRRWRQVGRVLLFLLAIAGFAFAYQWHKDRSRQTPPDAKPIAWIQVDEPPVLAAPAPAPVLDLRREDLNQMRQELSSIQQTVRELSALQNTTMATAPVVPPGAGDVAIREIEVSLPEPVPPEPAVSQPTPKEVAVLLQEVESRADPVPVAPAGGLFRIVTDEQKKFPVAADFAEMRTVEIDVLATRTGQSYAPQDVRVEVRFFDKDGRTGAVAPSRAVVSLSPPFPDGAWAGFEPKSMTATYVVPKKQLRRASSFYGYCIRVYYRGGLQDERRVPRELKF
jgi:hypothetical protein